MALLASACGPDSDSGSGEVPSHLLQPSDLTGVEKTDVRDGRSATKTNCAAMDIESSLAGGEPTPDFVRYKLETGDTVVSTVQGPRSGHRSIAGTFDEVDAAIETCTSEALSGGTFERLEGLPDGAVGFRAVQDTSEGPHTTERAYGRVDDESAAVVTVERVGEGDLSVTVADLLPTALERAQG
ncbi:MAG: hypothetical protein ABWX60_04950 [Aeromicrobium sp.]